MSLPQTILTHIDEVLKLSKSHGAELHALRDLVKKAAPFVKGLEEAVLSLQMLQVGIATECQWLKMEIGKARMTGELRGADLQASNLELHPANPIEPGIELLRIEPPMELMIDGHARAKIMKMDGFVSAPSADELERMARTLRRTGDDTELGLEGEEGEP